MKEMLTFYLDIILAILNFSFAAKSLHERRYMAFGFDLVFGIIFVSAAAAYFISIVVL